MLRAGCNEADAIKQMECGNGRLIYVMILVHDINTGLLSAEIDFVLKHISACNMYVVDCKSC